VRGLRSRAAAGPAPGVELRLIAALGSWRSGSTRHPSGGARPSVAVMAGEGDVAMALPAVWSLAGARAAAVPGALGADETDAAAHAAADAEVDELVVALFREHGASLVRMARLFVDDRNAAEDIVQEAFIRLSRSAHRIEDRSRAAAYLRSIVLNLARDHNRRGLVSLRHQLPADTGPASFEDDLELRDDQRRVIDALRAVAPRQRDCLVLRYYVELPIAEIATTLGISENSVKTHLKRGLVALEGRLGAER
jgi:RNA polymerase sigma factor (sigma-70 family)